MAMNREAEIRDLKRRVGELEGSCGKGTFGFLAHQISTFHKDLLAFQERTEQRFDRIDAKFDRIDGRLDKIDSRLDHIDRNVGELHTDMRKIVGDTMREVLAEQLWKKP
jgi:tetrahydromethanopterin S-methyltransferase subunit G